MCVSLTVTGSAAIVKGADGNEPAVGKRQAHPAAPRQKEYR